MFQWNFTWSPDRITQSKGLSSLQWTKPCLHTSWALGDPVPEHGLGNYRTRSAFLRLWFLWFSQVILLKCRFWFGRPGRGLGLCISNKVPGDADVAGPQHVGNCKDNDLLCSLQSAFFKSKWKKNIELWLYLDLRIPS